MVKDGYNDGCQGDGTIMMLNDVQIYPVPVYIHHQVVMTPCNKCYTSGGCVTRQASDRSDISTWLCPVPQICQWVNDLLVNNTYSNNTNRYLGK